MNEFKKIEIAEKLQTKQDDPQIIEYNNKIRDEQKKQNAIKIQIAQMKSRYEEAVRGNTSTGTNIDPNSHQKSMGKDMITLQNELKVLS
jgi:hypothetical protein